MIKTSPGLTEILTSGLARPPELPGSVMNLSLAWPGLVTECLGEVLGLLLG